MPKRPDKIKRSYVVERKPFERSTDNSEFYNSWAWRKFRKQYLDKNPLCVECDNSGVVTVATVVDHIVQIIKGGESLSESNVQSLCEHHHNSKSALESKK